jgi:hypothetical protein
MKIVEKSNAFLNDVLRIFQKPFIGLPLVMWCYFVISYIAMPRDQIWLGNLPDSDDYTYLSQTLDWLQGQSWFDNIQHRMSPPEGVAIHYTRFAEMPIAGMILLFRLFHYSWRGAALLGSFLLPLIYLGLFFFFLRIVAERFASKEWSRLSTFIVLFAPILMFKFAPGQVDHHGLEAMLTIAALGLTTRVFERPDRIRWAIAAGGVFALSTAIALEVLPWMVLASAVLGLWTLAKGRNAARSASAFGLSLFMFGAAFLVFDRPLADIFNPDLLAYSIAYVALMGGIAAALLGAAGMTLIKNVKTRFLLGVGLAVALGAVYLHRFPSLLAGPYGAMDEKLAALFFANLEEAIPLIKRYAPFKAFLCIFIPVLSLIVSLSFVRKEKDHRKWSWILLASFLAASIGLAAFYQIRVMIYAEAFSVIPLVVFVERGWVWIGRHYEGRRRFWAEIWLVLLIGPLPMILTPALLDGRSFNVGVLLFPAESVDTTCDIHSVGAVLNSPPYKDRKLRIMNLISEGAGLIFYTPHEVMSAPYHTNVRGNLDSVDFFSTTDAAQAEKIAQRDGINLVVLCHYVPQMYLKGNEPHYVGMPNGMVRMLPNNSFAGQLSSSKIPGWLKQIPIPQPSNYSLFEVKAK